MKMLIILPEESSGAGIDSSVVGKDIMNRLLTVVGKQ